MTWVSLTNGVYVNLGDAKIIRVGEPRAGTSPKVRVYWSPDTDLLVEHPVDAEKILKALDKESI